MPNQMVKGVTNLLRGWQRMAGGTSPLNLNHPAFMSEFFTFNCAIIGTNTAFSVKLNKTQLVAELKERIKTAKFKVLASVEADRLTLYKVNLDVSTAETNSKVLQAIEQNSVYCVREELQVQLSELSSTFKETDLPKTAIHVLVKCPAGESINSRICRAVAEIALCLRSPAANPCSVFQRSKWYICVSIACMRVLTLLLAQTRGFSNLRT